MTAQSDDELFAGMIAAAIAPIARETTRCPCGSGQHAYNLFVRGNLLLRQCCFICETPRRKQLRNHAEFVDQG